MEAAIKPKVRIIAPTKARTTAAAPKSAKRRVAGYARVSTDLEEQQTSYAAQVDYYTTFIRARPDWTLVHIYTDEGVTGTSTKHREGFNEMVKDALDGKIDLIVTKSVSRFARNTVDSLTTIRKLKERGCEVYFEKESIWTFDAKGELLITIMSSLAQEESRSISENVRWGIRKKYSDGRYSLNYKHFLGFDKGPDGKLVVNPEQAKIVERIYGMFLSGSTPFQIARILTDEGIPTPAGKKKWSDTTVRRVLQNESYIGDKLLQKTYSVDFLSKDRIKNHGEVQQYYIENDHEGIIPRETFNRVQAEFERRKSLHATGGTIFSGRIYCGQCGQIYGSKIWHSTDRHRRVVWHCNDKFKGDSKCETPTLTEDRIKEAFEHILQKMALDRTEMIQNLQEVQQEIGDVSELESEKVRLQDDRDAISDMLQQAIRQNASVALDQEEYNDRYDKLAKEDADLVAEIARLDRAIVEKHRNVDRIRLFIRGLMTSKEVFSEELWCTMVEKVTVFPDGKMVFTLTCGTDIEE